MVIMKQHAFLVLTLFLGINFGFSQHSSNFFNEANTFFKSYVSSGHVAYEKISVNPAELNNLVSLIEQTSISINDPKAYQAFYINAYNILVIKGIIDHYPLKSPLDKSGFFDKTKYKVARESITLNDIENKKLRAQFNDARFHFVLVCGALGCPPLIASAYLPNTLEEQLQKQTEIALNNQDFIKVKNNKVELSEIFKWYKDDFVQNGSEIEFINIFRTDKINLKSKVSYYPYNWNLNQQK